MNEFREEHEFEVPTTLEGERLDRAVALLTGWTRSEVQIIVARGGVTVDGQAVSKSHKLRVGETVLIDDTPDPVGEPAANAAVAVVVVHEDPSFFVVDKPAGLVVHPGAGHTGDTLVNGLLALDPSIAAVGQPDRPGIVHRLDRDTSGLLVVARTSVAYDALVDALARRDVERRYLALVWGHFDETRGVIDAPIGRSTRSRLKMAVREGGRDARTHYEVIDTFNEPECSLLELHLETGRTHQIRVHLRAIGHPVVGDAVYNGARQSLPMARPFLHAAGLAFDHPITGERVECTSPLPEELAVVLRAR